MPHSNPTFLHRIADHVLKVVPSRWQRQRCFGPRQVLVCVMHLSVLGTRTYHQTLRDLYQQVRRSLEWTHRPSVSAFSRARRKFTREDCQQAFRDIAAFCPGDGLPTVRYGQYRLLAVDATKLVLPNSVALRRRFGCPTTNANAKAEVPQALLTVLWDASRHRPVDWRLGRWKASERNAAYAMSKQLGAGDLLMGDRGQASRRIFVATLARGADFLMRVSTQRHALREVTAFLASGVNDAIVTLALRAPLRRQRNDEPLRVRLLRRDLGEGKVAVYATSLLDQQEHPREQLIQLYGHRWRVETAFREMKLAHSLEFLHARFVRGIHQEITAIMLYMLMASEFEAMVRSRVPAPPTPEPAKPEPSAQEPVVSAPNAVEDCGIRVCHSLLISAVASLLRIALTEPQKLAPAIAEELDYLWRYRSKVRPGRSYPRRAKSPNSRWRGGRPGGWLK